MSPKTTSDPSVYDLAYAFLADECQDGHVLAHESVERLAQEIQETIEIYLEAERDKQKRNAS